VNDDIIIRTENVSKLYGMNKAEASAMMKQGASKEEVKKKTGVTVALWDVSFSVKKGEIFVLIGLSGSGKSTVLRCLNLLNKPTSGDIWYGGERLAEYNSKRLLEFRRSKISMVFQNFGLMSHRTVLENVAFGLEIRKVPKEERERMSMEAISLVGLEGWENQSISSLSGGMKQRVGLARALANDPEVLLMDEPFSALDPLVRRDLQFELLSLQRKLEKTIVFVTHDINEAFKLGDTVAIMRDGKIIQIDTPEGMSANPADEYVRTFIDSADKTKVLTVRHILSKPGCLVRPKDTPAHAIEVMRENNVSTAFVIDDRMELLGIVTISAAVQARNEKLPLRDFIQTDVATTTEDAVLSDVLPLSAQSPYPLAVLDGRKKLVGIISKAAVLAAL
jgi:glycine betaine/proline transport system ATP-binding protein